MAHWACCGSIEAKDTVGWPPIGVVRARVSVSPPGTGLAGGKAETRSGFVNAHAHYPLADGLVYLATRVKVARSGTWISHIGHDGGAKVFVDGKSVYCDPASQNPARPGRARVPVTLTRGTQEIRVALDLDETRGWGIFLNFSVPEDQRPGGKVVFPEV